MANKAIDLLFRPEAECWSVLEQIAREGARKMLQKALEHEVQEYLEAHQNLKDEKEKQVVVRNGYHPERSIIIGLGPLQIKQSRVDDRHVGDYCDTQRFSSTILPWYLRRIPSIDNLIPVLYLKGISTNDFPTALSAILGEGVKGFSAANIVRLKQFWEEDYREWAKRGLSEKNYVYFWVDGIYFNVRLDDERSCILVLIGADKKGNKELIAVQDGYWESKTGWKEMLLELKKCGLTFGPKRAVGDGALGFWAALDEVFPTTQRQRCWVHKTANILDKLPKSIQSKSKSMIHDMYMGGNEGGCSESIRAFYPVFRGKIPEGCGVSCEGQGGPVHLL